jgi:hypothetical protein
VEVIFWTTRLYATITFPWILFFAVAKTTTKAQPLLNIDNMEIMGECLHHWPGAKHYEHLGECHPRPLANYVQTFRPVDLRKDGSQIQITVRHYHLCPQQKTATISSINNQCSQWTNTASNGPADA